MNIKSITIKNFRGIKELVDLPLKNLTILIGNNGTSKTAILEAINFCLSPYYLAGRIKQLDFHSDSAEPIYVSVTFDEDFNALLPDGYQKREVPCNSIALEIKRRDQASPGKAFSDLVVVTHQVVPNRPKDNEKGWKIIRKTGTPFMFDERLLSWPGVETEDLPRSFYFNKQRDKQTQEGYNTSFNSVTDEFNWRYLKNLRQETEDSQTDIHIKKRELEKDIVNKVDQAVFSKVFEALNAKLVDFDVDKVNIAMINSLSPFNSSFLVSELFENTDIPISNLGSGIEMIISLLFLETLASLSREEILMLIDEPELHLHPFLQDKLIKYLQKLSENHQIIVSTHSPYFFKNCFNNQNISLLIAKKNPNLVIEESTSESFGLFPWSPSWGEINFRAYGLNTIEFHNELYGFLQEREKKFTEAEIEEFFVSKSQVKSKQWIKISSGIQQSPYDVTLMTYIRNSIHHPENTCNQVYTEQELKNSTDTMISLI